MFWSAAPSGASGAPFAAGASHAWPVKSSRAFARQYEGTGDWTVKTGALVLGSSRLGKFNIKSKVRRDVSAPADPHVLQSCQGLLAATGVPTSRNSARTVATTAWPPGHDALGGAPGPLERARERQQTARQHQEGERQRHHAAGAVDRQAEAQEHEEDDDRRQRAAQAEGEQRREAGARVDDEREQEPEPRRPEEGQGKVRVE